MSKTAEINILGALIMDSKAIGDVTDSLQADMFTDPLIGRIYLEYQRAYDTGTEINIPLLYQRIVSNEYSQLEIQETIKKATIECVTSASIKSYAKVVIDEYKAKKLNEMLSTLIITPGNYKNAIGEMKNYFDVIEEHVNEDAYSLDKIASNLMGGYFIDKEKSGVKLGFKCLDEAFGDLEGGDIIVIGARPSVGKSAFVTQITSFLGKAGKRIGFFNLEMKEKQVYERFIANESGIGIKRLKNAKAFLNDEKERFEKANKELSKMSNIFIHTGSRKVSDIRNQSKHMGYDVIIIDYLQLLKSDSQYRGNRTAEVGDISKSIKAIAMDFNIPIIVLSQLNRTSELRSNKEPTMNELRESGDIEQDASIIILMWNLDENNKKKGLKIEKNRQGESGKFVFEFNGNLMRFVETNEQVKHIQEWTATDNNPFEV